MAYIVVRHLPKEEIDKLNATPRSLDQNLNNHASSVGNFRIKGFVNNNFVKASFPRTIPAEPILPRSDDPKVDLSPPRSNTQPQAPLSPPHHPPPPEMNGYHNQAPVFDRQNGYAPATNGHIMNGHSHDNGWARERPSPRYDSQDNPLSYRSVNQHQGTGRNFSEDYENTQTVPIRNAYAKTDDQIKKETRQFLDRQDEEKRYKEESVNKLREKHEEQRRTRQMMEESGPFGKPGAGAPNGNDYKKQKFREEQFYGHEQPKYQVEPSSESVTHRFQFWDSFGRPGHGAPLRTCSGNLKTQLVGDVIIRFQDRYVRDIENHRLHERPPEEKKKYFDDLRQQQQEKKSNGHLSSPSKPIGFNYMDYFGRCGPGSGAPMISESGHVKAQYQCKDPLIFFQNPDMAREQDQGLDGMPAFNSPGRNNLSSERERHHLAQQNLMKLRRENEMLEMSSPDPHTNPDPKQHGRRFVRAWDTLELSKAPPYREAYMRQRPDNGRQSNRPLSKSVMGFGPEYGHFEKDKRGISSPKSAPDTNSKFLENPYNDLSRNRYVLKPNREFQMPPYHPFGKAGGGAPRQDEQGNRVTQIMGLMDRSSFLNRKPDRKEDERMQDKIMKKKYRNELDQQVAQNMRKGTEQQRHQHEGQRDYAEIIDSSRRRPQSKHHLPRSDISLAKDGAVPLNRIEADKYRESLDEGFFAKQADRQLQRYKDNQESRQHVQQMTSYWGRYGGGYKKNEYTTHKGNLERLLNNEDGKGRFSMADVYVKGKDWSQFDEKTPRGDGFTSGNAAPHITPRFDSQDDVSPRYSRVTVDSYHANQYDYPHAVSTMKKDYEMRLPWAQH
ncbi:uncharacterized protein LOC117316392 isoform X5 [Pecten maximus]|uniref:uncharacterized protein LOC117316392 isoform X5 n=1 Tax=Pecten maximus TaxID=6579 RepID=UPI0014582D38|nr:uncharacterized protein LOC117316392 isoform X5 [Pecten maximus]